MVYICIVDLYCNLYLHVGSNLDTSVVFISRLILGFLALLIPYLYLTRPGIDFEPVTRVVSNCKNNDSHGNCRAQTHFALRSCPGHPKELEMIFSSNVQAKGMFT